MWRLLTAAIALFTSHQAAGATDITYIYVSGHPAIIHVMGKFENATYQTDLAKFGAVAAQSSTAIVFFESSGGSLLTGTGIGRHIRQRGFMTAVADYSTCASACALAWLGGKYRFMGKRSRIGFHLPRNSDSDLEISLEGTATVRTYLKELGINDLGAVSLLTRAGPRDMVWLTLDDTEHFGIAVATFSVTDRWWAWIQTATRSWAQHNQPVNVPINTYGYGITTTKPR